MTATTAQTSTLPSDPLLAAAHMMKAAGTVSMVGAVVWCSLTSSFFMIAGRAGILFAVGSFVLASIPFTIGYLVQASSRAMLSRYTFAACRRAAVLALFIGPIGLLAGIYSLIKLHEPGVRDSFNS
jgi:hypothetical protein